MNRMSARLISLTMVLFMTSGCSPTEPEQTARDFWAAVSANDYERVGDLIPTDDPTREFWLTGEFAGGEFSTGTTVAKENRHQEVKTVFKQDCYGDMEFNTALVPGPDGRMRVDGRTTRMQLIQAWKNRAITNAYCYPVTDQPLQGELFGVPWAGKQVYTWSYSFGTGREHSSTVITDSPCAKDYCEGQTEPRIIISQLDLSSAASGRNFSATNNITFYNPTENFNQIITKGSYHIESTPEGRRLGLRGSDGQGSWVNGYLMLD